MLEAVLVRRENGANRGIDEVVDHRGDDPGDPRGVDTICNLGIGWESPCLEPYSTGKGVTGDDLADPDREM